MTEKMGFMKMREKAKANQSHNRQTTQFEYNKRWPSKKDWLWFRTCLEYIRKENGCARKETTWNIILKSIWDWAEKSGHWLEEKSKWEETNGKGVGKVLAGGFAGTEEVSESKWVREWMTVSEWKKT